MAAAKSAATSTRTGAESIGSGAILSKIELFRGINARVLGRLEKLARTRTYDAGDIIVEEGSSGVALFVIRSGKVRVTQAVPGGRERVIRTMGVGESFGEMALFNNRPRSATVTAVAPTECLALHQFDFLDHLRAQPEVAIRLLDTVSQRLLDTEARLRELESKA